MKIRTVGTELLHADGQTDGKKEGLTDRYYEVNSRLSKFRQHSYKQRRNWGASGKTEKLGKDGLT